MFDDETQGGPTYPKPSQDSQDGFSVTRDGPKIHSSSSQASDLASQVKRWGDSGISAKHAFSMFYERYYLNTIKKHRLYNQILEVAAPAMRSKINAIIYLMINFKLDPNIPQAFPR